MGTTKPKQTISTTLTLVEKQALDKIATEWGLKAGVVLRRLVLFLLQNRISFIEILQNPVREESESESFISIKVLLYSGPHVKDQKEGKESLGQGSRNEALFIHVARGYPSR